MSNIVQSLQREANPNVPPLEVGDTVRVFYRIVEGDRERSQAFQGIVLGQKAGGANACFTVRRIAAHGVGVERTFFLTAPRLERVEVISHGHARRAKLYYLRERTGRSARLREKRRSVTETTAPAAE